MSLPLNERGVETLVDNELRNTGWNDNPRDKLKCNVYKQSAKTEEQQNALKGKRPDYVLYQDNSDIPLAVIETKKPHSNIHQAQAQAINYAKRIHAPIVYATDGIFTKTHHIEKDKPLYLNNEEVDELLRQSILVNYLRDNVYSTQDKKVIQSRKALISIFKDINELFRNAGVRAGLDRVGLLSNMLFLKIISELAVMDDGTISVPPCNYLWDNFKHKQGLDLLDFLNKQAFEHFKDAYGGEVLSKIEVVSGKEKILNQVVDKLDDLQLSDTNTDIKGDAFEFFLRNYGGAETDFGEYFTPRHIVKTMVKILNPQYGETVYDPFCGTGGMLIESFRHIRKRMPHSFHTLKKLKNKTVYGTEITTMERIAKMNMILVGDGHSNINRQDSYEHPQTNKHDVVITNIPFGSRMKTDFLSNYGFQGNSAELAGVLHCLDALKSDNENARAGILVPEGILFNGNKGYTALREKLVTQHEIQTVISLPQGVFTDAGVKSNVIIVKKKKNTDKKHLWYFTVKSDGYSLDKARRPVEKNDLQTILQEHDVCAEDLERLKKVGFDILEKEDLQTNKYILLSNQYADWSDHSRNIVSYTRVKLKDIILVHDKSPYKVQEGSKIETKNSVPFFTCGAKTLHHNNALIDGENIFISTGGKAYFKYYSGAASYSADVYAITTNKDICLPYYLYCILRSFITDIERNYFKGTGLRHLDKNLFRNISIPLPPLPEQERVVAEIKQCESVIDGAQQVVDNWKPRFAINPDWPLVALGEIGKVSMCKRVFKHQTTTKGEIPFYKVGTIGKTPDAFISKELFNEYKSKFSFPKKGDVLISASGTIGKTFVFDGKQAYFQDSNIVWIANDEKKILNKFLNIIYQTINWLPTKGSTIERLYNELIRKTKIPLPPIQEQERIVAEIEAEEKNIQSCKELIKQMEQKIQDKIRSIWDAQ